jgi:hypothetical protein
MKATGRRGIKKTGREKEDTQSSRGEEAYK